jgi:ABC-2 type transport system permease protein
MAEPTAGRLPALAPVLAGQVRYQLLLLLRSPRALWARGAAAGDAAGAHQPPAGRGRHGRPGRPGGPGRDLTAYLTHAGGLVAAREGGVLKRWGATPLPRWGYLAGRLCATVLLALASGMVTVLVGVLVYHARLSAGAALGLVVTLGLAALA